MRPILAAAIAAAVLAGCGYVAGPQPPLVNIPAAIKDLEAVQVGSQIVVRFTVPQKTTEGYPIRPPLDIDLRIGTFTAPFNVGEWAAQATPVTQGPPSKEASAYEIPAAPWTGKEVAIAARTAGPNHKESNWSNHVVVPVVAPLERPEGLKATSTAQGIRLTWRARGEHFRVLRRAGDATDYTRVADVDKPEWTDANIEYGTRYRYQVQGFVDLGDHREAHSELSEEREETPIDTFAPAAPAGLRAAGAPNSIELSWDRNTEADLAGYRVYRATGSGEFQKIAEVNEIPTYSDHAVEQGKTYRYAVTAMDKTGNESAQSAAAEATMQ